MKHSRIAGVSFLLVTLSAVPIFAQTASDFTVWKHPPVSKHPALDLGVVITGYTGSARTVTIPAVIDGSPVIGIGDFAFAGNTSQ